MKALVGAFNQEKALEGAFSVIVQPVVEPMELYTALVLVQDDLVLLVGQQRGLDDLLEVAVHHEVLVPGGGVAHGADPGRLLLVHHQEQRGVEALEVVAAGGSARDGHPHLTCTSRFVKYLLLLIQT